MTGRLNQHYAPDAVPPPSREAAAFHASLPGYGYTPLHVLDDVADELALGSVFLKDESDRLGLPAFKVLGDMVDRLEMLVAQR